MALFNQQPGDLQQGQPGFNIMGDLNQLGAVDPLAGATEGIDFQKLLFGGQDAAGNESLGAVTGGLGALAGIGNSILGYKQYGLAKKELAFQQDQARINNQNQMTTLNNIMRGQADNRRIATGGGPTGDEFIQQNGIRL